MEEVLFALQQAHGAQGNEVTWVQGLVIALVLAAAAALIVWRERVQAFARELVAFLRDVWGEVQKITWPTRDDLRKATLVILGFVVLVALVIGAMDVVLQWLLVRLPGSRLS